MQGQACWIPFDNVLCIVNAPDFHKVHASMSEMLKIISAPCASLKHGEGL